MFTPLAVPIFMLFLSLTFWADREATDRKAISVVSKSCCSNGILQCERRNTCHTKNIFSYIPFDKILFNGTKIGRKTGINKKGT